MQDSRGGGIGRIVGGGGLVSTRCFLVQCYNTAMLETKTGMFQRRPMRKEGGIAFT